MDQGDELQPLLPIAQFVRLHAPLIADYCLTHPDELDQLLDRDYSHDTFGLSMVSFFKLASDLAPGTKADKRYGKGADSCFEISGHSVRLTTQWFKGKPQQYRKFIEYLVDKGLMPEAHAAALLELVPAPSDAKAPAGSGKVKQYAIGDAQNLAIRTVLDRTKPGPTVAEWHATIAEFGDACAYCRAPRSDFGKLVFEHIVGINKTDLGENVIGNVVPACVPCNDEKGKQEFRSWIGTSPRVEDPDAVVAAIETHMARHGYVPLRELFGPDNQRLDIAIKQLREELDEAADRCAKIIKNMSKEARATRTR